MYQHTSKVLSVSYMFKWGFSQVGELEIDIGSEGSFKWAGGVSRIYMGYN